MKILIIVSILFSLTVATSGLFAAWVAPTSAPSESTNTPAPLNLGSLDQTKEGGISVKTLMVDDAVLIQGGNTAAIATGGVELQVEGKLGANQFCSEMGGACFTATEIDSLITGI